jgi:hypothetical protein
LFLDTMGFGCWLEETDQTEGTSLRGIAWHGKPQEWNISTRARRICDHSCGWTRPSGAHHSPEQPFARGQLRCSA